MQLALPLRRALCVGIDEYDGSPLHGCVNDASRIKALIERHDDGSPNFDCKLLIAPAGAKKVVTRAVFRDHLKQLFNQPADVALLHFSGHGTTNGLDGFLVTQDGIEHDEGIPMSDVLSLANGSKAKEVVVLLDCCYSGQAGNPPVLDTSRTLLREGVSILTGSRNDQPSLETSGGGVFTSLVVDALDGGAADLLGNVTVLAVYTFVHTALGPWDQRPLFKANVAGALELRRCTPPIERAILRRIPTLFPLPAEELHLDPSHEKTLGQGASPSNESAFEDLQALNRVHLVVPVGTKHMYDAAAESKSCRLTQAGRYYWRLATSGRI